MTTGEHYRVLAEKLAEGEKCVIWAERGSNITPARAANIAGTYDRYIYQKIVNAFGLTNFSFEGNDFDTIMDFSSWLVRGDGKLTILLLDIIDGYNKSGDSFIAGYFQPGNFYPRSDWRYSNQTDMIYVDTHPALSLHPQETYSTLAHELQHLINFVTSVCLREATMDTWIDEGLSCQAEFLYFEQHPQIRYEWFIEDPAGTIAQGNNFFVWGNYPDVPNAILDEYATVYLFFQWLYLQVDEISRPRLFYDIASSRYADYRAITDVAKKINPQWDDWEVLLRTWLAANYINDPVNEYGYKSDPALKDIKVKTTNGNSQRKVSLYPGEGVYSIIGLPSSYSPPAGSGGNIRYAGINKSSATLNNTAPYTGNVLLTFNPNIPDKENNKISAADVESGYVTGNSAGTPISAGGARAASASAEAAAAEASGLSNFGPLVLDARDMLGRHWETDLFKTLSKKYTQCE
ncbi:MAG: hypothetical protein LBH97_04295 [Treponema sp.]|nr:hypothetical protein [Treponema sp.]